MKRIVIAATAVSSLILFSPCADGMFTAIKPIKNAQLCMNMHNNFGRTHFIVGYDKPIQPSSKQKHPVLSQKIQKNNSTKNILQEGVSQVFFNSPENNNIREAISEAIGKARYSIRIAVFTLTDPEITAHLKKTAESGIIVEIITDFGNMNDPYSKINDLINCDIPTWHFGSINPNKKGSRKRLMHHKFMVIDDTCVITGSANWTKAGYKHNEENVITSWEKKIINGYIKKFDTLKTECIPCKK